MSEQVVCRPVPGFPRYLVGDDGSVWSRRWRKRPGDRQWRRLSPAITAKGYPQVNLCRGGRTHSVKVHRLVLRAFVGEAPANQPECRHLDGDPTNNHLGNLAWGSRQDNVDDQKRHGTINAGRRNGRAKLTASSVLAIHDLRASGWNVPQLADLFKIGKTTVDHVIKGDTWRHLHPGLKAVQMPQMASESTIVRTVV